VETADTLVKECPRMHESQLLRDIGKLSQELEAKASSQTCGAYIESEELYAQLSQIRQSLRGFTHRYLSPRKRPTFTQLLKAISNLVRTGLSTNCLNASDIRRTVKMFIDEFSESKHSALAEMAKIGNKLTMLWKLMLVDESAATCQC
jgi:hypothetical protein